MRTAILLLTLALFATSAHAEVKRVLRVPQVTSDPASPAPGDAWVLKTTGGGGGAVIGMLAGITYAGAGTTYQYSYRTKEATTVRATLT
jgi:hypothetical protein